MVTRKAHLRKTKTGKIVPVREAKINLTVPSNISDEELKQTLYKMLKEQGKMVDAPSIDFSKNPKDQSDIINNLDQEQLESLSARIFSSENMKPKRKSMWVQQILLNPNATNHMFEESMNHFPWLSVYSQVLPEYLQEEAAENWWQKLETYDKVTPFRFRSGHHFVPPSMVADNSDVNKRLSDYLSDCNLFLGYKIAKLSEGKNIIDTNLRDELMLRLLQRSNSPSDISDVIREGVSKDTLGKMQSHPSKSVQNASRIALRDKNWI